MPLRKSNSSATPINPTKIGNASEASMKKVPPAKRAR
jgi:hypothetical protein